MSRTTLITMHRYEKRILSGIVYVQRITDTRMSTANYRNLLMFAELPGPTIANIVVLVTTMWDKLSPEFDDGDKREQTWKEEYWNDMIPHGATVKRFLNNPESAWKIIDNVVNRSKNDPKTTFKFQEQAAGQDTSVRETSGLDLDRSVERQNKTIQEPNKWNNSSGSGTHGTELK